MGSMELPPGINADLRGNDSVNSNLPPFPVPSQSGYYDGITRTIVRQPPVASWTIGVLEAGITRKDIGSEWLPEMMSMKGIILRVTRAMILLSKAVAVNGDYKDSSKQPA